MVRLQPQIVATMVWLLQCGDVPSTNTYPRRCLLENTDAYMIAYRLSNWYLPDALYTRLPTGLATGIYLSLFAHDCLPA